MTLPSAPAPQSAPGPQPGQNDLSKPLYGASMGQAVKRFFKKYADFSGRASRSEFWWIQLFVYLASLVPGILFGIGLGVGAAYRSNNTEIIDVGGATYSVAPGMIESPAAAAFLIIAAVLGGIWSLAIIVPSLAIVWRRLHDANFAGPLFFLGLIPFVGGIIVLVFTLLPSKPEGQRFDRA